jgi:hypothetical protein
LTVFAEIPSRRLICFVVRPSANRLTISRCLSVNRVPAVEARKRPDGVIRGEVARGGIEFCAEHRPATGQIAGSEDVRRHVGAPVQDQLQGIGQHAISRGLGNESPRSGQQSAGDRPRILGGGENDDRRARIVAADRFQGRQATDSRQCEVQQHQLRVIGQFGRFDGLHALQCMHDRIAPQRANDGCDRLDDQGVIVDDQNVHLASL